MSRARQPGPPGTTLGVMVAAASLASLPEQLARTRLFTLGVPAQFTITRDGAAVLFLRSRAGDDPVTCLWALDLGSGAERLLADPAALTADPGTGISAYAADDAGALVAFTMGGALWTADVARAQVRRLPAATPVTDPRPDPTGQRIAYASGGALRLIGTDGSGDRVIMAPDAPDVTVGIAEEAGAVTLNGTRGYWWSPDGTRLLAARVDSSRVQRWYLADPAEPAAPPRAYRYPAAGTPNAAVTLWITGPGAAATQVRWDRRAFEYVPRAGWDAHGPYIVVQSRDQRTVRLLAIDPGTGQTTVRLEQRDDRWVQLVPGLPARTGSGVLVAHADDGATRRLTADGAPVTPPGLQLRSVLGIDGDDVLFTASEEPTETHLWRYRPAEGIRRLTAEPGVHSGVRRGGTLVHVAGGAGQPGGTVRVLRESAGSVRTDSLDSLSERAELTPRPAMLVLGPRRLRAMLFLPSWHRPGSGKLPVLADPYGGAAAQRVTAELTAHSLVSQWFAEQGFAVLVADGSGTPGRGPEWEREVYGDMLGPVLEDQVTAVREAARLHPDLDLGRAGIRGWSFGGMLAAAAVLRRPDVFRAAVAGAAVTDQRLYETHWRERFLGHPDEFPERYDAGCLVREAARLTRPLLLIHGLVDDNVHPANTLRLSRALLAAGRPHEVLLLPGTGHRALGGPATETLLRYQAGFLRRHLHVAEASAAERCSG